MSNRENVRRVCGDTDIVPYVFVEEVNEVVVQDEAEEPARINLNVFGFVRSTLLESDIARLYLAFRIDHDMYRLSVIPPPTLMTTSYTSVSVAHLAGGVCFPLDPSFVDFLHFVCIHPSQLHPNATQIIFVFDSLVPQTRNGDNSEHCSSVFQTTPSNMIHSILVAKKE